ncbi:hypothetical protein V7S43_015271 [Phytophthora oleae]|uniref:Uncharacterized protein n=1 Tax=Phytophthora oleae TaxID=2107226 RepID=A0ABD3EZU8_9STRA
MIKLRDILNAEHQLYLAHSSFFLMLKPLTPVDCQRELEESQTQVDDFPSVAVSLDQTRVVCEWSEKRFTIGGNFHTSIRKTLYQKSAQVLFGQTWRVFTSQWEKLFSRGMAASCRLVQLVDDDNILFCQNYSAAPMLPGKTEASAVNMMALVSRISTSTGHLITHRELRRGSVEAQDLLKSSPGEQQSEIWLEHFCWIHFEQTGKHCVVTVGGISPALRASSYFWVSAFVQFALRWEMVLIGPRFILQSDSVRAPLTTSLDLYVSR